MLKLGHLFVDRFKVFGGDIVFTMDHGDICNVRVSEDPTVILAELLKREAWGPSDSVEDLRGFGLWFFGRLWSRSGWLGFWSRG